MKHKRAAAIVLIVAAALFVVIVGLFNPAHSPFPRCPFYSLTGLYCPGCGSQRAMHSLLNFRFGEALRHNALLVLSIPYVALGIYVSIRGATSPARIKLRRHLFGKNAAVFWCTLIIIYFIVRNILDI